MSSIEHPETHANGSAQLRPQSPSSSPSRRQLPRHIGEALIAVGGLILFSASFLNWVSYSDGPIPGPPTTTGWEISPAAAIIMVLLVIVVMATITPAGRRVPIVHWGFVAAMVAVDLIFVFISGVYLLLFTRGFFSLGIGFWLALAGLLTGNVGLVLARRIWRAELAATYEATRAAWKRSGAS